MHLLDFRLLEKHLLDFLNPWIDLADSNAGVRIDDWQSVAGKA